LSAVSTEANVTSNRAATPRPSRFLLALGLASVLAIWSLNYIAGKVTLAHLRAVSIVAFRMQISAAVMLPIYFARRERARPRLRDLWTFVYLGFFGYAVNQGCFVLGLGHTTSEHSVVIIAMGPIVILLLAAAMRLEKLTVGKTLGMAISFFGVLLLETEQGSPMHSPLLLGDALTVAGSLGFALYTVFGKRVSAAYDTISMNTFNSIVAAVLLLPLAVHQGAQLDWKSVGWAGWAGLLYMAAISGVTGYLVFYWLLQNMDASRVVAVNYFQPIVVFLLSIPLLGEHPTPRLLASAALVLFGVYLAEHVARSEKKQRAG